MAAAVIVGAQHHAQQEEEALEEKALLDADANALAEDGAEEALPEYLQHVKNLQACKHIDHGQFNLVSIKQVEELFDALGKERDMSLRLEKILEVLTKCMEPPFTAEEVDTLLGGLNTTGDYKVSFVFEKDLHDVCHSEREDIQAIMKSRKQTDQQVTREAFVKEVARIVDRDDAFMTLPITMVYMSIFVFLIQGHLRIYDRRLMENSLEEFINGRDPRETADENIDDIDSLWEWIAEAGLRGPLGNVKNSSDNAFRQCIMASRNILIGDVQLSKDSETGGVTSVWLLKTDAAKTYLASHPYEYQSAAIEGANALKANGWEGGDILKMWMSFSSYNEFSKMFAVTTVAIPLPKLGNVYSKIDSSAVSVEPYPSMYLYIADSLFLCLALWIGAQEGKDAFAALKMGCSEFKDYLGLWNVIDWINIILCLVCGAAWLDTINYMINDSFNSLLSNDYKLKVDVMTLEEARLDDITANLQALRNRYWMVQCTMAANTVFVVMKFFKSFQSNARLKVVSTTFKQAARDLVHFAIMFSTIFLPFVIIAHILFGSDIQEFASVTAAINTGIMCLMGDFNWYVEAYPKRFTDPLPSGMPKIILMVWYVSFMFFVFLVLLNMLLAVIIEHYTDVSGSVQYEADAPAVWKQAMDYFRYTKATKGFIPLETLRNDLENDEDPKHYDEVQKENTSVTVESLQKAWPQMTEKQAGWLMDLLDNNDKKGQEAAERKIKAEHVKHLAEENKEKLLAVADSILDNKKRLDQLEGTKGGASDIADSLDKLANTITDLNVSVAKVRREHDRLASKVDDMVQAIPEGTRLEVVQGGASADPAGTPASGKVAREWKKGGTTAKAASSKDSGDTKDRKDAKDAVASKSGRSASADTKDRIDRDRDRDRKDDRPRDDKDRRDKKDESKNGSSSRSRDRK